MPVVLRVGGYRFFFYANQGTPREARHVHVECGDVEAKFWLRPAVHVAYNDGLRPKALREALELVEVNRERFERA